MDNLAERGAALTAHQRRLDDWQADVEKSLAAVQIALTQIAAERANLTAALQDVQTALTPPDLPPTDPSPEAPPSV